MTLTVPDVQVSEVSALDDDINRLKEAFPRHVNLDPHSIESGLAKLVLSIVELIRQMLERQAVRRMEGGSLTEDQIEALGLALMKLEEKTNELREYFGLKQEELMLKLGPLGRLTGRTADCRSKEQA
ncbi:MAG: gas vesicle protein K [Acidobacteria bacterium]|nr:gas vesicle protein K [Acidobacteriota bacterium]